jgi:hypothetical protein
MKFVSNVSLAGSKSRKVLLWVISALIIVLIVDTTLSRISNLGRILIVDDDPDITLTFKASLDGYYYDKRRFEVYTYNNPVLALSEFKANFYDLLLTDINMPHMMDLNYVRIYCS